MISKRYGQKWAVGLGKRATPDSLGRVSLFTGLTRCGQHYVEGGDAR